MKTNSALLVPAQPTNQAQLTFQDAVQPPVDIFDGWLFLWLTLAALILGLAAFFLWRHWRKKAALVPPTPLIPPHERARHKLEQALSLLSEPKPFTIAVSDVLRQYLEERFEFHAPDRTTEEFLLELQGTTLLTVIQKQSLAQFLSSCDLVKFAKYEPTEMELRGIHSAALRLVNETEPSPIAPEIGNQTPTPNPQPAIQ